MNVIDIGIILFIIYGFIVGFKNGFTKQLVKTIGFILVIILAYYLKNPLSGLFYTYLPFIKFGGSFSGVAVLNVLVYELFAFVIVFSILLTLFKVLVKTSSFFEKILKMTIILGIPSKILGGIVGIIEHFAIAFIVLYILSLPMLETDLIDNSKFANKILTSTPILSNICDDTLKIYDEIEALKDEYAHDKDKTMLNKEVLKLLLEHNVISEENINNLVSHGKINYIDLDN